MRSNIFEKVDLAIEALRNAPQRSTLSPAVSNADLAQMNNLLTEAQLPQMPPDVMYFLSKVGACTGPYCDIHGIEGLHGARDADDVSVISCSRYLNRDEEDLEDKGLVIGHIQKNGMLRHDIVYKNEKYYLVEDERGAHNYFLEPGNFGDVILHAIKWGEQRKRDDELQKMRNEVEKWSD